MSSVFISYSHDPADPTHAERVAGLAASLIQDGLNVFFDQNRGDEEEKVPWEIWMEDKILEADHVLLICTELYLKQVRQEVAEEEGQGVCWEANIIYVLLYRQKRNTTKFLPVVFSPEDWRFIPTVLKGSDCFMVDSQSGYERLYAFLTGQQRILFTKQGTELLTVVQETVKPLFALPGKASFPAQTDSVLAPDKPILAPALHVTLKPDTPPAPRQDIRGLDWYDECDAGHFLGRSDDADRIFAMLLSKPVIRMVGPSGVGKSSLIRAGLLPKVRELGWRACVVRPFEDPARRIPLQLTAQLLTGPGTFPTPLDPAKFRADIAPLLSSNGINRLVLFLDQFEDIIAPVANPTAVDVMREFLGELWEQKETKPYLRAVVVYRIDADARLGRLWQEISGKSEGLPYFALQGLSRSVTETIINHTAREQSWRLETSVADIVRQLTLESQKLDCSDEVFPVYLQIFLKQAEQDTEGRITTEFITSLGGMSGLIGKYLEQTLGRLKARGGEWQQCGVVLESLSRSTGAKVVQSFNDLVRETGVSRAVLAEMLPVLITERLVRPVGHETYEIQHDRLAADKPIVVATAQLTLKPDIPPAPRQDIRGLDWYDECDAGHFMGRSDDADLILAMLLSNPIIRLVGPSGVGKSSLIRAGLLPKIREFDWRACVIRPFEDPDQHILPQLTAELLTRPGTFTTPFDSAKFRAEVTPLLSNDGINRLVLFLDQFEDIVSPPAAPDAVNAMRQFLQELWKQKEAQPSLRAVVVYRTDADARLGRLWQEISGRPEGLPYLALEGLGRSVAENIINQTAREQGWPLETSVPEIARQLTLESQKLNYSGEIFPVYLQIFLKQAEQNPEGRITADFIASLGGVSGLIGKYLEQTLGRLKARGGEWLRCAAVLESLSGSGGAKVVQSLNDLVRETGLSRAVLAEMLPVLINERLVRSVGHETYEIQHDHLAAAVIESAHYGQRPDRSSKITKTEPPKVFVSYAWGDTSSIASEEDRQRQEVVERLCQTLEKEHWQVVRDETTIKYGDRISDFMKKLGQSNLVIVVLSAKYLHSPFCMTELYGIYQKSLGEKEDFLRRIIPLALADARIGAWRDRVTYAKHWETEFKAMEQDCTHLGEEDLRLYKAMKRWHNDVGDMLAYLNDVLVPHGFEDIVQNDFAALCQMLSRCR